METVLSSEDQIYVQGSYVDYTYLSDPPIGGYQEGLVPVRLNSNTGLFEYYDYDTPIWRVIPSPISSFVNIAPTAGTTIQSLGYVNRIVTALSVNDLYKTDGFTKPYSSDTITFTDGTELIAGDKVVTFFL